jgi:hypothetical protein
MPGHAEAADALFERRRNFGEKILEFSVVQLTLLQLALLAGKWAIAIIIIFATTSLPATRIKIFTLLRAVQENLVANVRVARCWQSVLAQLSGPNSASRLLFRSASRSRGSFAADVAPSAPPTESRNSPK